MGLIFILPIVTTLELYQYIYFTEVKHFLTVQDSFLFKQ